MAGSMGNKKIKNKKVRNCHVVIFTNFSSMIFSYRFYGVRSFVLSRWYYCCRCCDLLLSFEFIVGWEFRTKDDKGHAATHAFRVDENSACFSAIVRCCYYYCCWYYLHCSSLNKYIWWCRSWWYALQRAHSYVHMFWQCCSLNEGPLRAVNEIQKQEQFRRLQTISTNAPDEREWQSRAPNRRVRIRLATTQAISTHDCFFENKNVRLPIEHTPIEHTVPRAMWLLTW